jgi:uracil-DNA glycosylase
MDPARALALARLGIVRYVPRGAPARASAPADAIAPSEGGAQALAAHPGGGADRGEATHTTDAPQEWERLAAQVRACTACGLCRTRTQTVFGVGDRAARWLVIGEAPGAEEDARGEPFVGRAGKLLDAILYSVGLDRTNCYIANVLKCRPPGNRDPHPEEAAHCRPFLDRQIALIRPRLILAVGRIAAQHLLGTEAPVGKLRGRVHRLPGAGTPLVVTYHPAYLLRSPQEKRKVWDDLCLARAALRGD